LAASAPRFALRIATDGHATAAAAEPSAGAALLPLRPNPAADRATVAWRLAAPGEARVTVVDLLGRTVAEVHAGPVGAGLHHAALDTARLAAGVYVVRLLAGGTVHATRLTVVR